MFSSADNEHQSGRGLEIRARMNLVPCGTGSDVREQPQQPATSTVVACEVDGVLEELMIAMSIGPTLGESWS